MYDDFDAAEWAYQLMLEQEFKESEEGIEWANKWLQDLGAVEVPHEIYEEIGQ